MANFKYSVNSWVFGPITVEDLAKRAKRIGLDGLEIDGEPEKYDIGKMKAVLEENGLAAVDVCGTFQTQERAFNNNNREQRAQAVAYAKSMVDMAVELGTDKILVVPSQVGAELYVDKETDWKNSVEALTEVARYAKERGVSVMLECVNKYEVHMVYSLADGVRMAREIGTGNVGVVADTFHMQLEEKDGIANAIRNTGTEWILHQHLGDNNREVPGKGCMDWKEILAALRDIGYEGYLSFEPVPAHMGLTEVCTGIYDPDVLEDEMTRSLQMLRGIENLW